MAEVGLGLSPVFPNISGSLLFSQISRVLSCFPKYLGFSPVFTNISGSLLFSQTSQNSGGENAKGLSVLGELDDCQEQTN